MAFAGVSEQLGIHPSPAQGVVVGGSAHHRAVHGLQVAGAVAQAVEAAIEFDGELGPVALELVHQVVTQRRDGAVLLGIQPIEPGFARVHGEALGPRGGHRIHEVQQFRVGIPIVDADPVLHRHRQGAGGHHGRHATGYLVGIGHQAGPETSLLHLFAGATHIEVDFVVAPVRRQLGGFSQQGRIVAAHLQGKGMLDRIKAQQPLQPSARLAGIRLLARMVQGLGHHHFAIEQAATGDLPHQHPEVPIGVVHHRSHTEAVAALNVVRHLPMLPSRAA